MPVNKDKVIAAAQKYVEKGQYEKAIKEYLKVVQEDGKDVRIWLKVGDLYAKKGSNSEAVETYEKVAATYSEQGFYFKAVAVYKQILKLEPKRVDVNLRLAELYKQLGLLSDAMQQFELAATLYAKEGKTRESLEALKQMVEMDPDNVASRIKLAESYSKEGMAGEAVEEFTRAAEQLKSANRMEDYIKVAERLAWHKPEEFELAKELAALYIRRSDPRRALTKLQACFKKDPRDVVTLELLAEAFQDLGQHQKTLSVLKELAKVLHENHQIEQRDGVYRRILELEPQDEEARAALGMNRKTTPSAQVPAAGSRGSAASPAPGSRPGRPFAPTFSGAAPPPPTPPAPASPRKAAGSTRGRIPDLIPDSIEEISAELEAFPEAEEMDSARLSRPQSAASRSPAPQRPPMLMEEEIDIGGETDRAVLVDGDGDELPAETYEVEESGQTEPSPLPGGGDEEIERILTESDVYIKYGLHEKAIEHLSRIFERDPSHLPAHLKLKDLYVQADRPADAVGELLWLAETVRTRRPQEALQYVREGLDIDPSSSRCRELLRDLTGEEPEAMAVGGELEEPLIDESDSDPIDMGTVELQVGADGGGEAEPSDLELEDVGIEVEDPTSQVAMEEMEQTVSGTIELEPDEVELDEVGFGDEAGAETQFEATAEGDAEADEARGYEDMQAAEHAEIDAEMEGGASGPPGRVGLEDFEATPEPMADDFSAELMVDDPSVFASHSARRAQAGSHAAGGGGVADERRRHYTPTPTPVPLDPVDITDDLEEAEFFLAQGLADQAQEMLQNLLEAHPDHPLILAKLREIGGMSTRVGPPESDEPRGDSGRTEDSVSHAEMLELSRRAVVDRQIGEEDFDTHYDLGIAYKEMGLHEDAIHEFKLVMKAPGKEVLCHTMIGLCYSEKGLQTEAISQFKKALYVDSISEREQLSLYYELGTTYERLDDPREALYYYEKVAKKDGHFRDIERRIGRLKVQGGGPPERNGGSTNGNGNGKAAVLRRDEVDEAFEGLIGNEEG